MRFAQLPVKVDLRGFKEFVAKNLDETTPLYKVLMSERDEVSREEFAAKFDVCLRLTNLSLRVFLDGDLNIVIPQNVLHPIPPVTHTSNEEIKR